jgi:hypothetical protein
VRIAQHEHLSDPQSTGPRLSDRRHGIEYPTALSGLTIPVTCAAVSRQRDRVTVRGRSAIVEALRAAATRRQAQSMPRLAWRSLPPQSATAIRETHDLGLRLPRRPARASRQCRRRTPGACAGRGRREWGTCRGSSIAR